MLTDDSVQGRLRREVLKAGNELLTIESRESELSTIRDALVEEKDALTIDLTHRKVWYGMVWYGMVWYGMGSYFYDF